MQPLKPDAFPKRVKRFQSYSMTPLDSQVRQKSSLPFQLTKFSDQNDYQTFQQNARNATCFNIKANSNAYCSKNSVNFSGVCHSDLQDLKKYCLLNHQESCVPESSTLRSDMKKHQKSNTTNMFLSSPMKTKQQSSKGTSKFNMSENLKFSQRKIQETELIQWNQGEKDEQKRKHRVPSFLLNRKKQMSNSTVLHSGANTERNMSQSSTVFSNDNVSKRLESYKKPSIGLLTKLVENERYVTLFEPPSNHKIAFSKATASTLCTNLPREESRRTFRDFEEMAELKEIENSMEESDNSAAMQKQFENLFTKESHKQIEGGNLESEMAQLFSDEELKSEEFNEELKDELENLF